MFVLGHTPAVVAEPCIPVKQTIWDSLRESIPVAQQTIAQAKRIVIAGGGPVGIEMAGEIADAYPDKSITMVFAGFRLLDNLKGTASIEAGKKLNKLGIVVRSGAKVRLLSRVSYSQDIYMGGVALWIREINKPHFFSLGQKEHVQRGK
jgi:NADH dehydrogenase FAD-containing subunit